MTECVEEEEQKMEAIRVFVRGLEGKLSVFDLGKPDEMQKMTVLQLKEKLVEKENVPVNKQRLIFNGRVMRDSELLSEYNVQHGGIIQLAVNLCGGGETRNSLEKLADFLDSQAPKP